MTYNEVVKYADTYLLAIVSELYELNGYEIRQIEAHERGRNVVYNCEKEGADSIIIRITFLTDRNLEDLLGEAQYIRYLYEHGASVSNVISSGNGNLVEEISYENHTFLICLFDKAKGKMFVDNNYRYREGVPITEYYYNCNNI